MADNLVSNPGAGGATFATDDIGGIHWPFAKLAWGPLDTATVVNTGASAIPIQDGGNSITVDGTVVVSSITNPIDVNTHTVTSGNPDNFLADVRGMTSRDSVMADAPVITGGRASTATPAAVSADGDVVDAWFTRNGALNIADGSGSLTIDATSLPLPTGAATSALQTQPGVDIGDVTINNAAAGSAVNIQDGGNSITVDGSVSITGSIDTELPAAAALADATANPTVPGVGAFGLGYNGTTWDRIRTANTGRLQVDVVTAPGGGSAPNIVDNAGFTDGTTVVSPIAGIFDEVAGTALTENDAAAIRIDAKRATITTLEDATTRGQRAAVSAAGRLSVDASGVAVPVTDNAGSLTVDSTQLPAALVGGRLDENVGAWLGSTAPTVGSKTSANSVPVVIASDQGAVAITGTLTAVTSITNVVHVDDNASSLTVDGTVAISGTTTVAGNKTNNNAAPGATNVGTLPGVATAAAPSYTEGNQVALSTDLTGALRISGGGGGTQYVEDNASIGGETVTLAGAVRSDSNVISTSADGDFATLKVDNIGRLRIVNDESFLMRSTLERIQLELMELNSTVSGGIKAPVYTVNNPLPVTEITVPVGGCQTFELVSANTANPTVVKATTGVLNGFMLYNTNAAARYIKFYDSSVQPTAGTKPKLSILVPGASAGAGNNIVSDMGIQFTQGISFVTVTGAADSDATSVGTSDLVINILYT